ncbi:MAG TPA: aminotransferase DegT [Lachnospiraceae bacterium]|nr:aminotransferase DegT [Lachnospiraceae bacterium]
MKRFEKKVFLATPTMHGEEREFIEDAFRTNWVTTAGHNIDEIEEMTAKLIGCKYAVGLTNGTAALHMATKLAGERLYGMPKPNEGTLKGKRVFCSDITFDASVNPVAYEDGEAVFIDTERDTWNMDPQALEAAFSLYPEVRLVIMAHLYGTPGRLDELKEICRRHGALFIEDAAESMGALYKGRQTGSFGDYNAVSFNGNKIITGSGGGMFLTDSKEDAERVRKWSTQSREAAPWYEHEEIGYNYRISNVVAGIIRGQLPHLKEHIARKKEIYERYREGFKELPVSMNPYDAEVSEPNFWLSCLLIDKEAMCSTVRGERSALYISEPGKTCPTEILEAMAEFNAEGRPIWKPMHAQPIYRMNSFIMADGNGRGRSNAYIDMGKARDVSSDIFERGLCLPSDIKMTEEEQDGVIEIVKRCFG